MASVVMFCESQPGQCYLKNENGDNYVKAFIAR